MSAIPCASVSLKTMADGTLRIAFDVEPMHAQDAFRLFAAPGTPAALAALQVGYAAIQPAPVVDMRNRITEKPKATQQAQSTEPITTNPKGGVLAKLAGMWCADPEFHAWVNKSNFGYGVSGPDDAAQFIRDMCDISSRAELDNNPQAASIFHQSIRGPYSKHMIARGIVA